MERPAYLDGRLSLGGVAPGAVGGFEKYPLLWAALSDPLYTGGAVRELHSLLLFVEGGALKACISDRQEGLVCFRTAGSLSALLAACEKAMEAGGGDWRPSRPKAKR